MANTTDLTAKLPDGNLFDFWEVDQVYEREIHVNNQDPRSSDENEGTITNPLKTINAAAQMATPGTRILIHGGVYRETVQPAKGDLGQRR